MRGLVISIAAAAYLYGSSEPNAILNEVTKLRQKYEECRQGQSAVLGIDPKVYKQCEAQRSDAVSKVKGYQTRIANLEMQVKENNEHLSRLQTQNTDMSRELTQKRGVIKSLEQTLTARDQKYREAVERNEVLNANDNAVKVSKIERESLKRALVAAKTENERLEKELKSLSSAHPENGMGAKLQAMQSELAKAKAMITRLQNTPAQPMVQEKIVYKDRPVVQEKVVYKDRPVIQEKIVTKVIEPTEKIKALQNELAASQATVAKLKNVPEKVVVKEKIVPQERVVYKERIVTQEKVVYKDRPVVQEKVVYKDRPVIQEKIVTKVVEPTEKINALQSELAAAKAMIANLKNAPVKVVVKEKIVPQEKVVYKDRPVEKIVTKTDEAARRQMDKLALELERQKSMNQKLSKEVSAIASTPIKTAKPAAKPALASETVQKVAVTTGETKGSTSSAGSKKAAVSPYRMAANAPIYNAPNGRMIDTWEARRSFTAGLPSGGWVHITGYFVNRVWQPTREDENLWVKESDVIRR